LHCCLRSLISLSLEREAGGKVTSGYWRSLSASVRVPYNPTIAIRHSGSSFLTEFTRAETGVRVRRRKRSQRDR